MTEPTILAGAEPLSAAGGPTGVLVLHGFTGNPSSMRGIAEACAAAGHTVEMPRLSGHGTTVEDMLTRTWSDWTAEVAAAYDDLAARTERVVVVGLSMGGALTAWLGTQRPDVAGLVLINAAAEPAPDMHAMVQGMVDQGETLMPGIGSDVADPDVTESAYSDTPLPPLLTMFDGIEAMQADLSSVTAPALIMTSPQDHVVAPSNSDHLAATLQGPIERVSLERSYHVATIDHDRDLIVERILDFIDRVA
ncbi:MAG TPA: alpha/beta fold hydrolase [Acidimicrobiales bacterium]|nr:alpha/beta fold hydrolase [Acidimicrobiales bacterium]